MDALVPIELVDLIGGDAPALEVSPDTERDGEVLVQECAQLGWCDEAGKLLDRVAWHSSHP